MCFDRGQFPDHDNAPARHGRLPRDLADSYPAKRDASHGNQMGMGTDAQQRLAKTFFNPFFNWDDDDKLRAWLREQDADELEQFLNWFDFGRRRDRETLGRQELRRLREPSAKFGQLIKQGRRLLEESKPVEAHNSFESWAENVAEWMGTDLRDPGLLGKWSGLPYPRLVIGGSYDDSPEAWVHFRGVVTRRITFLGDALSGQQSATSQSHSGAVRSTSRRVFIVHGHDDAARETVHRFLGNIGFEAIVLHEQSNRGRTIIEKFEANSDVGFAVIILTPDDVGGKSQATLQPRVRQNVVIEWGYFIGRLGRSHVCALMKGDVELPSDILGIAWHSLDDHGGWKARLVKELESADFDIDWELVKQSL